VRRTILTNLLWAFGYNSIGLGLAVSGHLQPVLAAVLMAGSSLLVVLNSLRLERFVEPSDDPASASEAHAAATHEPTRLRAATGDLA
jgi:Cu2+-exporting ATPase